MDRIFLDTGVSSLNLKHRLPPTVLTRLVSGDEPGRPMTRGSQHAPSPMACRSRPLTSRISRISLNTRASTWSSHGCGALDFRVARLDDCCQCVALCDDRWQEILLELMPHSYTNRTTLTGSVVTKVYHGPVS